MSIWSSELSGVLHHETIDSVVLRDNPLGDPHVRPIWVYTPPGYDGGDARYPVIYVIQGYSGAVTMWGNRTPFRQPFVETADRVFAEGRAPGCVIVYVDAWTAYGGSQFVDSPGTGKYHTYLCDEVVPWVDARYRTIADPAARAISGKSSGGFGAMITPMLRPDLFGMLATHAGDNLYEYAYLNEFAKATRALREYGHDIQVWWADFNSRVALTKEEDMSLVMVLGCSAAFSADPDGTPRLPFDPRTGQLIPELWERWLAWDPVRMIDRYADALRGLSAVWIDAGTRDEWFLDLGAEAFHDGLRRIGVPADRIHFELFPAGHGAIDYRYPLAVAWLAERLRRD
ncbi:alpha/beta hydrolase-fold protein [Actinoplanes sp. NBRC 101535]|uniref:alpha/beta hydrolase-fold protein n=1 Tax=Actinoplanes sp. NBRC 101535 TaxID=3032196 RepID=UPI0024A2CBA1|nr:alpha/beta hydrolase-fold protein [Actinoplanes sp. NBRC 101535]GLY06277.1 enterochelin esterase [Actinoplanes sp. NBRC 101535]